MIGVKMSAHDLRSDVVNASTGDDLPGSDESNLSISLAVTGCNFNPYMLL
jgi:hypothetical protein